MPNPTTQPAAAQPTMKSHVSPPGIVHTMCIVTKGTTSPVRIAAAPVPVAPAVAPMTAVPAVSASLTHPLNRRCGV
jgi:hypothetical protein